MGGLAEPRRRHMHHSTQIPVLAQICYILIFTQGCDSSGRLQEYDLYPSGVPGTIRQNQAASVLFSSISSSILGAKKNLIDPMSAIW